MPPFNENKHDRSELSNDAHIGDPKPKNSAKPEGRLINRTDLSGTHIQQEVKQSGKYGVNLGEGHSSVHIGDLYYGLSREETERIIKEQLWSTEYRRYTDDIRKILNEELRAANKNYAQTINSGLTALSELLHDEKVRNFVTTYQVDFRSAQQRISTISQLKALHDLLHTIEVGCYSMIQQESDRFPDTPSVVQDVALHHISFQTELMRIQLVCEQSDSDFNDVSWIADLQRAERILGEAICEVSCQKLKLAIYTINRVISNQPSRINTQLTAAARALHLSELTKPMSSIEEQLLEQTLDTHKVDVFSKGLKALINLGNSLATLVIAHDIWQSLDMELRTIEPDLENSLLALEVAWPDIKNRAEPVFDGVQDDWVALFYQDSQNLDAAMLSNNPAQIKHCFHMYRRRASARFYRVDCTLKRLCDELSKVGERLSIVLDLLG